MNVAVEFAATHKLDAVILAAWWHEGDFKGMKAYVRRFSRTPKVIVVGPPLVYTTDVYKIIARRSDDLDVNEYVNSYVDPNSVSTSHDMAKFAHENELYYLDRIHYFCEDGCPVLNADGRLLITDYGHLKVLAATLLGQRLLKEHVLRTLIDAPRPIQLPTGR
jgi:hypothetical protein